MNTNGRRAQLDYLEALRSKDRAVELTLGGLRRSIKRARLGRHLELQEMLEEQDVIDAALGYVSRASDVPADEIQLEEVGQAFRLLVDLNAPIGIAALARARSPGLAPPAFRYRGRGAAAFVHDLAFAYGWTVDYILGELGPEEAWCYLQEIHYDRFQHDKTLYSLSDVGRDKRGHQKPLRDPVWSRIGYDVPKRPGKVPPPRRELRPIGKVVDLSAIAKERRTQHDDRDEARRSPVAAQ